MKKFAIALAALIAAPSAHAVTVALGPGNVGIASIVVTVTGTNISIEETWTSLAPGSLLISGLSAGVDYTVTKTIINNTGFTMTRLANELLDPAGNANDSFDPDPQPGFVPPGFSTSNDFDGLSFAQGSGIPRVSSIWSTVFADELTDARDFLDFFNGSLADGASGTVSFGLRDNVGSPGDNQPFLLFQRPNTTSVVPAPAALGLFGLGLLFVATRRRG